MPTYVPTENESMPVPIMMKLGRICVRYGSTLCSPKASDYFGGPGRSSLLRSIYLQVHAVILCFTPASAKKSRTLYCISCYLKRVKHSLYICRVINRIANCFGIKRNRIKSITYYCSNLYCLKTSI
jgi:hypothetical protein